jgi:hypothetical protein
VAGEVLWSAFPWIKWFWVRVRVRRFNATFNTILVLSWRIDLLVGETGVSGENHDLSQVTDKLYHKDEICSIP